MRPSAAAARSVISSPQRSQSQPPPAELLGCASVRAMISAAAALE